MKTAQVAIIMGSESDLKVMQPAQQMLSKFGISSKIEIVSAHRTPDKMFDFAKKAHEQFKIIIAGAGGAAHLPGMVASLTPLPVIGVPVKIGKLDGLDALLSVAQMPKGVPVATMAVDNAANAGLLAVRILAIEDAALQKKLVKHQGQQKKLVSEMNARLRSSKPKSARSKSKKKQR